MSPNWEHASGGLSYVCLNKNHHNWSLPKLFKMEAFSLNFGRLLYNLWSRSADTKVAKIPLFHASSSTFLILTGAPVWLLKNKKLRAACVNSAFLGKGQGL